MGVILWAWSEVMAGGWRVGVGVEEVLRVCGVKAAEEGSNWKPRSWRASMTCGLECSGMTM